ncbi:MAG TPA: SipW-dependent-type signal peptide-containing protein [Actinomycetales bacterium]|nr:SipW-dependent-type signal peptide-containing protein [Actinomycetales bacterium]
MAMGRSAVLLSVLAAGALLTTGSTYAAFSDSATVTGNHVGAATVVVGGEGGSAPDLAYSGLQPGSPRTSTMNLRYAGSIAADLWLELEPGTAAAAFCEPNGHGWQAKPGGALQVSVGGGAFVDYCSALGGQRLTIREAVAPSTTLEVDVALRLRSGTDGRYSGLTGVDGLVVRALQTGGAGFSDYARGTITVGAGDIAPTIPQECLDAGLARFDKDHTIYLTDGDDVLDVGKRPLRGSGFLVFGLGGDDVIVGSNQADCLVGGAGDDHLIGGNQDDVLLGGDGDDVLGGPVDAELLARLARGGLDTAGLGLGGGMAGPPGDKVGGNGKDRLFGGAGDDVLHGANGKDYLDGGDDVVGDVCIDEPNGNGSSGVAGGNGTDTFVNCEVREGPAAAVVAGSASTVTMAATSPAGGSATAGAVGSGATSGAPGGTGSSSPTPASSTPSGPPSSSTSPSTPSTSPATTSPSDPAPSEPTGPAHPTGSTSPPVPEPTSSAPVLTDPASQPAVVFTD